MLVERSECGCELHMDAGQVVRVDTCPVCLPAGAITWIIENGRQLELSLDRGVPEVHERGDQTGRKSIERASVIAQRLLTSFKRRLK